MIIDFHTHVFPEAIASGTIEKLEAFAHIKAQSNGLLKGLKASMEKAGVDYSVILPVVTKPSQFRTVNEYAASINGRDGIISFGGIHPDTEDYQMELDQIRAYGLPGIKLHPDYQKVHVTDPRYLKLITYAVDLGLIVTLHAGVDIGLPDEVYCPPEESVQMLQYVETHAMHPEQAKIILAHTGGYAQWDAVEELLVGKNVYFDLAYTFGHIETEQLLRIIRNHGADRILFATDSPWNDQKADIEALKALNLTPEEEAAILGENARTLLHL
ncbi:MAG: amidohydrolase family protein [Lachnospiraceae bacterium]|nr:amidohydrolase family protein [Lachnospiraceae bacterium]